MRRPLRRHFKGSDAGRRRQSDLNSDLQMAVPILLTRRFNDGAPAGDGPTRLRDDRDRGGEASAVAARNPWLKTD